jgi:hypothetical protein
VGHQLAFQPPSINPQQAAQVGTNPMTPISFGINPQQAAQVGTTPMSPMSPIQSPNQLPANLPPMQPIQSGATTFTGLTQPLPSSIQNPVAQNQPAPNLPPTSQVSNPTTLPPQPLDTNIGTNPMQPITQPNPYSQVGTQPISPLVSDENLKTNIKSADHSLNDFLNKINAHSYTYKDQQDGQGTFTSPMAQELEATELGKQAVLNTPRGKMVDYARLGAVNLAATSVVHRENQKLQKQINELRSQVKKIKG